MNYLQHPMQNPGDISNPTTAFNMALALMAKAFTLNDTTPTNNNQRRCWNSDGLCVVSEIENQQWGWNVVTARLTEGNVSQDNEMLLFQKTDADCQKEESRDSITSEEFDFSWL
ncbi:hypothetical protein Tco_0781495 [Tanacetum coccineum]